MGFLLCMCIVMSDKKVEVRFTDTPPRIDGIIEEVWNQADSAYDFVQHWPDEKVAPTEKTVAYVLQDEENLYVAFRCYAEHNKPVACLTADEDHIALGVDPFGSNTTAYYFLVYGSNIRDEGWILDDGRTYDDSWDGVWYRAVNVQDDRLEAEFKIPFKSIRYKKGLEEWGIQFRRYITANREMDYWTEVSQVDEDQISKWGTMTGITPQSSGYYFELYPEGYIRYDRHWYATSEGSAVDSIQVKPSLSMNFKWDITSQTTMNATAYPDFAQIESDPFTLNLGRYPTYLSERRPFFLEGKDIFRMSDFGEGKGFFDPLNIFYSRRVGRSMNGDAVPIIGGLKLTHKTEDWNIGVLGAYTDEYERNDTVLASYQGFGVVRVRRRMLHNSDVGVMMSGSRSADDDYNYAIGIDGVYRKAANQLILQAAVSDNNEKQGWAFESGYFGFVGDFLAIARVEAIHDSFDVSEIGFVPWAGQQQALVLFGPFRQYQDGALRNLFAAPGVVVLKEPGHDQWSKIGVVEINPNFRNNWGGDLSFYLGPYYEADTNYLYRSVNLSVWGNLGGNHMDFGCNYSYTYNYQREYLAYQGSNWLSYRYSIIPQCAVSFSSNLWVEWDSDHSLVAMWPLFRPRVDFRFNADMMISLFSEFVMFSPHAQPGETELMSVRTGMLFAWNFLPKSWFYIAFNDYRADDGYGHLDPQYQIGAIKAKYLLYF
jgi:hypothetical protein